MGLRCQLVQACAAAILIAGLVPMAASLVVAQQMPPMWQGTTLPGVSRDDTDRMHAAATRLYEGQSIGTVERWRNPDTGNSGTIELLREFETSGMPCRSMKYLIRFGEVKKNQFRHYLVNWCKTSSGEWKILERPRAQ